MDPTVSEWADTWELEDFSNAYRNWLETSMNAQGYSILFDLLHDTKFEWSRKIPRDSDRSEDGRYLRLRFANEAGLDIWDEWLDDTWPCSFLEFLVALAYSIDDKMMYDPEKPDQAAEWFWEMMSNMDLAKYDDQRMLQGGMLAWFLVSETVDKVMGRRYDYNGNGGLFPLRKPAMDQRKVEIWYQANAYMIENYFW